MRTTLAILALVLVAVGAVWMYRDRKARVGGEEAGTTAAVPGDGATRAATRPIEGRDGAGVVALLPGDAREVLEQADRLEVLALHPSGDSAPAGADVFHDYRVLGRAALEDPDERRALIAALYEAINANQGEEADCFNPRHGLHAVRGDRTVDLVICFECLNLQGHGTGPDGRTYGNLVEAGEPAFDAALKRHGLRKHRRGDD